MTQVNLFTKHKQTNKQKTNLWLSRGNGEGWIGSLELANADYTYRVGKQQGPTGTIANLL